MMQPYLTEEDPGEEDLKTICDEIAVHVSAQGCPCTIIFNRGQAIQTAIMESTENTVVLVAGKGRETRQKRGTEYVPVPSDVDYIRHALKAYDKSIQRNSSHLKNLASPSSASIFFGAQPRYT